jgi:hypothetical protein
MMRRAVFCGWKIRSAAVLALLSLALAAPPPRCHAAVEAIPLHYRNPTEVLPLVRAMLSPEGRISADERTNSLIVVASETLRAILEAGSSRSSSSLGIQLMVESY